MCGNEVQKDHLQALKDQGQSLPVLSAGSQGTVISIMPNLYVSAGKRERLSSRGARECSHPLRGRVYKSYAVSW